MPASEARIAAARLNGARSVGPITAEGKAVSRRNALKHGRAGEGVVVPESDAAEVERRAAAMLGDFRPESEMGRYLVRRLAGLTVRVERCSERERAMVDLRVAHAGEDFDADRLAEVDRLLAAIGDEPATHARRLRSMPEGVDRMGSELLDLRDALAAGDWDRAMGERLAHLTGLRWSDVAASPIRELTGILLGDPAGGAPAGPGRLGVAREALAGLILEAFDRLQAHRETLDLDQVAADRAGAPARALFDPSKEAALARRYEAAAERGVYKALDQLREAEAEAHLARTEEAPAPAPPEAPAPVPPPSLGSFRAGAVPLGPGPRPDPGSTPEPRSHQPTPTHAPRIDAPTSPGPR